MYIKNLKISKRIFLALIISLLCLTRISAFEKRDTLNIFLHHPLQLNYVGLNVGISKKVMKNVEVGVGIYSFFYYRSDYRQYSNTTGLNIWARYYYNNFFVGAGLYNGRSPYLRELDNHKIYILQYDIIANAGYRQQLSKKYYLDLWAGYNLIQKTYSFNPVAFSLWAGVGKRIGRK